MSAPNIDLSGKDVSLKWRNILGLEAPEGYDFAHLFGKQYEMVARRAAVRVAIHICAAGVVWWICHAAVSPLMLSGLGLLIALSVGCGYVLDRRLGDAEHRTLLRSEVIKHALVSAFKGAAWSVSFVMLVLFGAGHHAATLWAVLGFLLFAGGISRYSVPLSTVSFFGTIGLGALLATLSLAEYALSGAIIATIVFAVVGTVEASGMAIRSRIDELEMIEKRETVSMLLREFEDGQADWLWQIDTRRRLRAVSPRLAFALGRNSRDIEGQPFLQLMAGDEWDSGRFPASLHELAERLKGKESFSNLIVRASINGQARWWELSGTPMFDESGKWSGFRGVGSDVTAQRESSEKIEFLARFDTLTQLPNRMQINESLAEALSYAGKWRARCALLMIDLDRFKAINDSLGHLVGDRMLAQVAGRLAPLMEEGELCGRLGGDEFAVVIRDASNRRRVATLAKSIIAALSDPYHIDNQVLYVGASVGSCIGPRDGTKVEELLRNADLALYRAKDEGGGVHCEYEPSLHSNAEERRVLEFALRSALEKEELVLHYQPVVDANSEDLVSFEALVRWNSKEHGFISPAKFIPLAEDTRLIVPIGTWVMQEACREAAQNWPSHVKVNINVSPEQLIEPDFAGTVVRALSHSGLDPKRLEIEVTESIFMRDADIARKALEQCLALGCSVALDDFGTGYSSLGYLRTLKFTTIKVDRTFVQGAAQNSPESLAIIRAVVAMADSLDMTTTAEGVENDEEAEMIRHLGCDKIQGFHFGRPMPAEDARRIFKRSDKRRA